MFIPYALETEEERRTWLTEATVALNVVVAVFVGVQGPAAQEWILTRWGFKAIDGSPLEAVTSMFLHAHWAHLAVNMLFLWIFGRGLERAIGAARWAVLYLAGGLAATAGHAWGIPAGAADIPAVGASGAISAIMGAAAVALPTSPVHCVYFVPGSWAPVRVAVPSAIFAVGWYFLQVFLAVFFGGVLLSVAFWAHVAGFAAGATLVSLAVVLPGLRRRRARAAASSALEEAFEAFRSSGERSDVSFDADSADERLAAGLIRGEALPEAGVTAASAFVGGARTEWTGLDYLRAIDAFSHMKRYAEAAAAGAECLERREDDPAEPELLGQMASLLERRLKQPELGRRFAKLLVERHPDSVQARESKRRA